VHRTGWVKVGICSHLEQKLATNSDNTIDALSFLKIMFPIYICASAA